MANCNCNQRERMQHSCESKYDYNNMPIGMAYVPWQHFKSVYDVDKALAYGTIFPELNKPFFGKRGVRG